MWRFIGGVAVLGAVRAGLCFTEEGKQAFSGHHYLWAVGIVLTHLAVIIFAFIINRKHSCHRKTTMGILLRH
jgi:hypothetical protein